MKKILSQENILTKELQLNGIITLQQAMKTLNVSEATARRIFTRMSEKGLGIRSHGKICLPDSSYSFYRYETSEELYVKEKRLISKEALKLIKDGDTLFLDSGTTVCLFSMALAEAVKEGVLQNIKVFTNSFMIINILNEVLKVNLIGGEYRSNRKDFCGYITEKVIKEYRFDKCILGTDGFYKMTGFTTTDNDSARICETAIEHSENTIVLMDSHKYNKASSVCYSNGNNISIVITDKKLSESAKQDFFNLGINVKIAEND